MCILRVKSKDFLISLISNSCVEFYKFSVRRVRDKQIQFNLS